jgi:hypothetical protein
MDPVFEKPPSPGEEGLRPAEEHTHSFVVGDVVSVSEFKRPGKNGKVDSKVNGGIARIIAIKSDGLCDLNFFLEIRRAADIPLTCLRVKNVLKGHVSETLLGVEGTVLSEGNDSFDSNEQTDGGVKRERKRPKDWAVSLPLPKKSAATTVKKIKKLGEVSHGRGVAEEESLAQLPLMDRNTKAFKQGPWRKEPFGLRE